MSRTLAANSVQKRSRKYVVLDMRSSTTSNTNIASPMTSVSDEIFTIWSDFDCIWAPRFRVQLPSSWWDGGCVASNRLFESGTVKNSTRGTLCGTVASGCSDFRWHGKCVIRSRSHGHVEGCLGHVVRKRRTGAIDLYCETGQGKAGTDGSKCERDATSAWHGSRAGWRSVLVSQWRLHRVRSEWNPRKYWYRW